MGQGAESRTVDGAGLSCPAPNFPHTPSSSLPRARGSLSVTAGRQRRHCLRLSVWTRTSMPPRPMWRRWEPALSLPPCGPGGSGQGRGHHRPPPRTNAFSQVPVIALPWGELCVPLGVCTAPGMAKPGRPGGLGGRSWGLSRPPQLTMLVPQAKQQAHVRGHMAEESKNEYAACLQHFNQDQSRFYFLEMPQIFNVRPCPPTLGPAPLGYTPPHC